nr:heat shock protein 90-6, mitochondrial [Tanacetum cinerariifolium]GFB04495.1 heat shock protein 90-6, mitochondrial [Tanacetum cinerariifolium]GFB04541.1 heat shock protein 90-6, mitochondrial [Tanacetum cinerariifolium]
MKAQIVGVSSTLDFMRSRRVLEINPEHLINQTLSAGCKSSGDNKEAMRAIDLLYDTPLVSSGYTGANETCSQEDIDYAAKIVMLEVEIDEALDANKTSRLQLQR